MFLVFGFERCEKKRVDFTAQMEREVGLDKAEEKMKWFRGWMELYGKE